MTKILNHISFARDWLNRAEDRIRAGNNLEGELFLSLAESEIKKAWEISVEARKGKKDFTFISQFNKVVITALAIIVLVVGVNIFFESYQKPEPLKLTLVEQREERFDLHKKGGPRLINVDFSINK